MEWLTENKLPVGDVAADGFDWLQANGVVFFDALSDSLEAMIDGILWVLQTPHPLIVVAIFGALTYALQRSWKAALFTFLGFLFILNQGYWEETTESLRSSSPPASSAWASACPSGSQRRTGRGSTRRCGPFWT